MAKNFNVTALIRAKLDTASVTSEVKKLRTALTGVNVAVNLKIAKNAAAQVQGLTGGLQNLHTALSNVAASSTAAATGLKSVGKATSALAGGSTKANNLAKSMSNANTSARQTSAGVKKVTNEMREFGRVSGLAVRRFAGFTIATGVVFGLIRAITSSIREAVKFEREMIKVAQVTGTTLSGVKSLGDEIGRLSKQFGANSTELLEVSRLLTQTGIGARQTKKALEAIAKSNLAPTFGDMKQTTEGAIAVMAQFGIQANQLEKALGSVNAVAGQFAVESENIIAAVRRTGGVFAAASGEAGQSLKTFQEFIAVFTSIRSATRESSESIATGLRTITTRLQRGRTVKFLKENFDINLTDAEGKFVGMYKAVDLLGKKLSQMDTTDPRFMQIGEELGGFRQIGKTLPLLTRVTERMKAFRVAQQGVNSLSADAVSAQASLQVQLQKTAEGFKEMIREVVQTDTFKNITSAVLRLANAFIHIAKAAKTTLPLIAAMGAIPLFRTSKSVLQGFGRGVRGQGSPDTTSVSSLSTATKASATATSGNTVAQQTAGKSMDALTLALKPLPSAIIRLEGTMTRLINTLAVRGTSPVIPLGGKGAKNLPVGRLARPNAGGLLPKFHDGGKVPGGRGVRDDYPAVLKEGEYVLREPAVRAIEQTYGKGYLDSINRKPKKNVSRMSRRQQELLRLRQSSVTNMLGDNAGGLVGYNDGSIGGVNSKDWTPSAKSINALLKNSATLPAEVARRFGVPERILKNPPPAGFGKSLASKIASGPGGRLGFLKLIGDAGVRSANLQIAARGAKSGGAKGLSNPVRAYIGSKEAPIVGGLYMKQATDSQGKVISPGVAGRTPQGPVGAKLNQILAGDKRYKGRPISSVALYQGAYGIQDSKTSPRAKTIKGQLKNLITDIAGSIFSPPKGNLNKTVKEVGIEDASGKIFEGGIKQAIGIYNDKRDAPFDFMLQSSSHKETLNSILRSPMAGSIQKVDAKWANTSSARKKIKDNTYKLIGSGGVKIGRDNVFFEELKKANRGGPIGFKDGGDVPSILTRGEYVMGGSAVNRIGVSTLDKMNQFDRKPFNMGGLVGFNDGTPGGKGYYYDKKARYWKNAQGKRVHSSVAKSHIAKQEKLAQVRARNARTFSGGATEAQWKDAKTRMGAASLARQSSEAARMAGLKRMMTPRVNRVGKDVEGPRSRSVTAAWNRYNMGAGTGYPKPIGPQPRPRPIKTAERLPPSRPIKTAERLPKSNRPIRVPQSVIASQQTAALRRLESHTGGGYERRARAGINPVRARSIKLGNYSDIRNEAAYQHISNERYKRDFYGVNTGDRPKIKTGGLITPRKSFGLPTYESAAGIKSPTVRQRISSARASRAYNTLMGRGGVSRSRFLPGAVGAGIVNPPVNPVTAASKGGNPVTMAAGGVGTTMGQSIKTAQVLNQAAQTQQKAAKTQVQAAGTQKTASQVVKKVYSSTPTPGNYSRVVNASNMGAYGMPLTGSNPKSRNRTFGRRAMGALTAPSRAIGRVSPFLGRMGRDPSALLMGGFVASSMMGEARSRTGSGVQGGLQSGLSMAGIGGLMGGPWGMAIGGLVGATTGAITAIDSFESALMDNNIEKALAGLASAIERSEADITDIGVKRFLGEASTSLSQKEDWRLSGGGNTLEWLLSSPARASGRLAGGSSRETDNLIERGGYFNFAGAYVKDILSGNLFSSGGLKNVQALTEKTQLDEERLSRADAKEFMPDIEKLLVKQYTESLSTGTPVPVNTQTKQIDKIIEQYFGGGVGGQIDSERYKKGLLEQTRLEKAISDAMLAAAGSSKLLAKAFDDVAASAKRAASEGGGLGVARDMMLQLSSGNVTLPEGSSVNRFSNARAYTEKELQGSLNQIGKRLGVRGTEKFDSFRQAIIVNKALQEDLPKKLVALLATSPKGNIGPKDYAFEARQAIDSLPALAGVSKEFKDQILNAFTQLTGSREGSGPKVELSRQQIFSQLQAKLSKLGESAIKALEETADAINKNNKELDSVFNARLQAEIKYAGTVANLSAQRAGFSLKRDKIFGKYSGVNIRRETAPVRSKIQSLIGGTGRPAPAGVAATMESLIERIRAKTAERDATGTADERAAVNTELMGLQTQLGRHMEVMKILASDTSRLAAIQSKVQEFQKRKESTRGFMRDALSGSPQDQLRRTMQIFAATKFIQTEGNVAPGERKMAYEAFDALGPLLKPDARQKLEDKVAAIDAKTTRQLIGPGGGPFADLIAAAGKGAGESTIERELASKYTAAGDTMFTAGELMAEAARIWAETAKGLGIEKAKEQDKPLRKEFREGLNKARGGILRGGIPGKDSIPVLAQDKEFVMQTSAVSKYGVGFMNMLNEGKVQMAARGGFTRRHYDIDKIIARSSNIDRATAMEKAGVFARKKREMEQTIEFRDAGGFGPSNKFKDAERKARTSEEVAQAFRKKSSHYSSIENNYADAVRRGKSTVDDYKSPFENPGDIDARGMGIRLRHLPFEERLARIKEAGLATPGLDRAEGRDILSIPAAKLGAVSRRTTEPQKSRSISPLAQLAKQRASSGLSYRQRQAQVLAQRKKQAASAAMAKKFGVSPDIYASMQKFGELSRQPNVGTPYTTSTTPTVGGVGAPPSAGGAARSVLPSVNVGGKQFGPAASQGKDDVAGKMSSSIESFGKYISSLSETISKLENMSIEVKGTLDVNINGAEAFASIKSDFEAYVKGKISDALNKETDTRTGETKTDDG